MHHLIVLLRDEEGATAIEYALIASLISVGIIVGAGYMGRSMNDMYVFIRDTVVNAGT